MSHDALHFQPSFFGFLRELAANNERDWFQANKPRYAREVKEPLQSFIAELARPLAGVSGELVCDPKRSMFRVYRDVRFSRDKSPYKTHAAAQFRHVAGKDAHAPGAYLHLAPGSVFFGAGIWRPDRESLGAIRQRILERPEEWSAAVSDEGLKAHWRLAGSSLKRAPRGFDRDHPLIDDLKRKDFILISDSSEADACAAGFGERLVDAYRAATPVMRFLTAAVGVSY